MIYPNNYEQKIGFDHIREQVRALCATEGAAVKLENTCFSDDHEIIVKLLEQTFEMRTALMMESGFPSRGFVDTAALLEKLEIDGTFLETEEIIVLRHALDMAGELVKFFAAKSVEEYPRLKALSSGIENFPQIINRIDSIIDQYGKIKDNASPELNDIRKKIRSHESQVSHRLHRILAEAQASGIVDSEATISIRDGRAVIPVPAANKRKLKGFIHDESATGKTFYIEPVEIVEINNELKELEYEQRREIIRILLQFAEYIRPEAEGIARSGDYLTTMDFICAKAKHALANDCTKPIVHEQSTISLLKARHILLAQTLKKESKEVVPLNMTLTADKRILLISGPNAGGKSVCLKTVGLLQYMLQCGMLISASENSEMGIFTDIFIDIGDEQSIDNDLSTYSSHLLNMKNILRHAGDRSLILIDEFGTGTEPVIGGAIAEAVLEQLVAKKCFGVITTHYSNLKYYASNHEGIMNGAMMFDVQNIRPLFSLEIGRPGSSFAIEIARKIGLPESIMQRAMEKAGTEHVSIERQLREIARDRRYWEQKRDKVHQTEKRVDELAEKYKAELEKIKAERTALLNEAKTEAQQIIAEANKQIERTIREIKESQADKQTTLRVRREVDSFRENLSSDISDTDIERKIAKLKEREQKRTEQKIRKAIEKDTETKADLIKPRAIEPGVKVRMTEQQALGEVLSIKGKKATVAFGQLRTTVDLSRLEAVSNSEFKKFMRSAHHPAKATNFSTAERRQNFSARIDVRGMRAMEAIEKTEELLDDAVMLGVSEVRILHGKGTGALKEEIRQYLNGINIVKGVSDEHVEMGGAGITVVKLKI